MGFWCNLRPEVLEYYNYSKPQRSALCLSLFLPPEKPGRLAHRAHSCERNSSPEVPRDAQFRSSRPASMVKQDIRTNHSRTWANSPTIGHHPWEACGSLEGQCVDESTSSPKLGTETYGISTSSPSNGIKSDADAAPEPDLAGQTSSIQTTCTNFVQHTSSESALSLRSTSEWRLAKHHTSALPQFFGQTRSESHACHALVTWFEDTLPVMWNNLLRSFPFAHKDSEGGVLGMVT